MCAVYEVRLAETAEPAWGEWFAGWEIAVHPAGGTLICGEQSGRRTLSSLLQQIEDSGLTLLAVHRADTARTVDADTVLGLLHEKEAQYRSIFEATSDGIVIRDPTGRIVEVNPAYCRMHNASREEMIGTISGHRLSLEEQQVFDAYLATVNAGQIFRSQNEQVDRNGRRFAVEALGIPFRYAGRPHILGIVRDITERVQAFEQVEQRADERTRELATLLEVSRQVASTLDLVPLLQVILTQVRTVLDYGAAAMLFLEGPTTLRLMIYNGPIPQEQVPHCWSIAPAQPIGTPLDLLLDEAETAAPMGHAREVVYSGAPVIIPDVRADTPLARAYRGRIVQLLNSTVPEYVGTWMGVPLIYRDQVIGVMAFDHEQPGAYTEHHAGVALAVASQAAVAIANARLLAEVQGAAAEAERQRLARELHDAVTQQLFSASIIGEVLPQIWTANPEQGAAYLEDLRLLTKGALAEMRALLVELRPTALTDTPLPDLLHQLSAALSGRTRVPVELRVEGAARLPDDAQVALYRVAQEALQNVAKHAKAQHVWVTLRFAPAGVELVVRDDGRGFDPTSIPADHFGLGIMQERMAYVGGTVTVESALGQGTTLTAHWPGV
jgi:PAS domain S-box-containing protein